MEKPWKTAAAVAIPILAKKLKHDQGKLSAFALPDLLSELFSIDRRAFYRILFSGHASPRR